MESNIKINLDEIMREIRVKVEQKTKRGFYKNEDLTGFSDKKKSTDKTGSVRFNYYFDVIKNNIDVRNRIDFSSHRKYYGSLVVMGKKVVSRILLSALKPILDNISNLNFYFYSFLGDMVKEMSILKSERKDMPVQIKNYLAFENTFRGPEEMIRKRQAEYLKYFKDKKNVLDIGCGRGEFLELLGSRGITATGIDINDEMISLCQKKNFNVKNIDAFDYLRSVPENSFDGMFVSQVVEHMNPEEISGLTGLCYKKLSKDGVLIIETINPQALITFSRSFYIDMTHKSPVHPNALMFLLSLSGFKVIDLLYISPVDEKEKLKPLNNPKTENERIYNENIEMLNSTIYGCQDYSVIVRK